MKIQEACEIVEMMLALNIDGKQTGPMTGKQFLALNVILLEMQATSKYSVPVGIH